MLSGKHSPSNLLEITEFNFHEYPIKKGAFSLEYQFLSFSKSHRLNIKSHGLDSSLILNKIRMYFFFVRTHQDYMALLKREKLTIRLLYENREIACS